MANCSVCGLSALGAHVDDVIQCNGPCNSYFHIACVNLPKESLLTILSSANIRWLCDGCIQSVPQTISDRLDCMTKTISSLSTNLASTFSQLAECSTTMESMVTVVQSDKVGNSLKRRRLDDQHLTASTNDRDQSDQIPTKPDVVIGSCSSIALKSIEPRKLLVVSMLDTSTKADDLVKYLKDNSNINIKDLSIRCSSLLPVGRNIEDLDFISFKLNVPESIFSSLLQSSIWPKGVTAREFVTRPGGQQQRRRTGVFLRQNTTQLSTNQ